MITSIVGAQFGDEGKGKITDYLTSELDSCTVVRWSGGSNAGHTIQVYEREYKLKLVPSGALNKNATLIITGSCLIDLSKLMNELEYLKQKWIEPNLIIDKECTLTLPLHKELDIKNDSVLNIGTTKSGIGPTASDYVNRIAISIRDVLNGEHVERLLNVIKLHSLGDLDENLKELNLVHALKIYPNVTLLSRKEVIKFIRESNNVIFEGAQGSLLDINHGTYPFCTSTPCLASAIPYVTGIGNLKLDKNIGVFKAYITRVGHGEFRTELLEGKVKEHLQSKGKEIGTNTGRTRRVGWLNIPNLIDACELNNFNELALVKIDVLSGLDTVAILDKENNWWTFDGWDDEISTCKTKEELPKQVIRIVEFIESQTKLPVTIISVGPDRNQTIRI